MGVLGHHEEPKVIALCVQWQCFRHGTLYQDPLGAGWHPASATTTAESMASAARRAAGRRFRESGYRWAWRVIESEDCKQWFATGLQSSRWRDA